MGQLKPGATYIYEKADGITYAREFGSKTREAIGWDYTIAQKVADDLWRDIRMEALTNPTLQKALDRAIIIYNLSKDKLE